MAKILKYFPGDLIEIVPTNDPGLHIKKLTGKLGLVYKNLGPEDGVYSSDNMYAVMIDGLLVDLHCLELHLISGEQRN